MISKTQFPGQPDFTAGEVILIDKPLNFTSFDVIRKIKKNIQIKKIGHAGTLDPLATGLLIICTGSKTKTIDSFQALPKTYTGEMYLGATTPCYDKEMPVDKTFDISGLNDEMILLATKKFMGKISQFPPVFSALKVDGKSAYKRARKGEDVQLKARDVEIYEFEILKIDLPYVIFSVKCSKGTYIRSLVHDFGKSLENGAYLSQLRRTAIGDYLAEDALTPDEFIDLIKTKNNTAD